MISNGTIEVDHALTKKAVLKIFEDPNVTQLYFYVDDDKGTPNIFVVGKDDKGEKLMSIAMPLCPRLCPPGSSNTEDDSENKPDSETSSF